MDQICICPGCGNAVSLVEVQACRGACPACGYAPTGVPARLLTVQEMLDRRTAVYDGVALGQVLRTFRALSANGRI